MDKDIDFRADLHTVENYLTDSKIYWGDIYLFELEVVLEASKLKPRTLTPGFGIPCCQMLYIFECKN